MTPRDDAPRAPALLEVTGLCAGYGANQVLFDVSLTVRRAEVVTLLGRNGMGKSTTIRCLSGLLAPRAGGFSIDGRPYGGEPSYRIARAGIGLVPEGRQVFPTLTVRENLVATAVARPGDPRAWTVARVFELFPRLAERIDQPAGRLSGGEQQMLAIGRALMTHPRLLLLDEATEGLAPLVRREIWRCLATLKAAGQAMIVIDKHLGPLTALAARHYLMHKGRIVWSGHGDELTRQPELVGRYIGV
mgnify:FL=1